MFEKDALREQFVEILRTQRETVDRLEHLLTQAGDSDASRQIAELQLRARRQVDLSERLVEIVS
jgi:hypothetical protein